MSEVDTQNDTLGNGFKSLIELKFFITAAMMVGEWCGIILKVERNETHPDVTEEQRRICGRDWRYFISRLNDWFRLAQIDLEATDVLKKFQELSSGEFFEWIETKFER